MLLFRNSRSRSTGSPRSTGSSNDVAAAADIGDTGSTTTMLTKPSAHQSNNWVGNKRRRNNISSTSSTLPSCSSSNYNYIYLLVGGCVGIWCGLQQHLGCSTTGSSHRTVRTTTTTETMTENQQDSAYVSPSLQRDNNILPSRADGWQTIHVYHGPFVVDNDDDDDEKFKGMNDDIKKKEYVHAQKQHNLSSNNTGTTTSVTIATNSNQQRWYSQAHQDELVIGLLQNRTSGYFIDLAANDARDLSNTYALEQYYNWSGICIEPNPIYWYNLSYYRRHCHIVGAVIGSTDHREEEIYFRFNAGDHGGIANDGFNNGKRWQRESFRKYTIPLLDILQQFDTPNIIDYMSFDVEGAETYILYNFPFDDYTIRVMTAERLRGPIRQYLNQYQYKFMAKLTRWGESLWVHQNHISSTTTGKTTSQYNTNTSNGNHHDNMDWSVLQKYNFPI